MPPVCPKYSASSLLGALLSTCLGDFGFEGVTLASSRLGATAVNSLYSSNADEVSTRAACDGAGAASACLGVLASQKS